MRVVRIPAPINQLFIDESIAVQIIFLDPYMWNSPWNLYNTTFIRDFSHFKYIL